jgi:hypothetical protein
MVLNFRVAEPLRFLMCRRSWIFRQRFVAFIGTDSILNLVLRAEATRASVLRLIRFSVIGSVGFSLRIFVRVAPKPAG